ncbi:MAG: CpsB/CapC family capsule biosynthesis tyrosine phosphatase [Bacteroidota bacterium]
MKWFSKKQIRPLLVDIHSHLIPGIDDGAPTIDSSLEMIALLQNAGFKKLITTPHIHPKYPNKEDKIIDGLADLRSAISKKKIDGIEIGAAAEYYITECFINQLESGKKLLSFGDKYILIECSFSVKPFFFESVIYKLKEHGYKPILAHPERYRFLEGKIEWLRELKTTGLLFQVTLSSLVGYYGEGPQKIGFELIKNGMVNFLATDLHRASQVAFLKKGLELREVQNLLNANDLMNEEML